MDFKVLLETIDRLDEKITKDTPMGKVIKDFQQSDAPQFKGKSKKKRKQMALAAKLSKESVDDLYRIRKLSGLKEADEDQLMGWYKKYNKYDSADIGSLADGMFKFFQDSGVDLDTVEKSEYDALVAKHGEDKIQGNALNFLSDEDTPITKAMFDEFERIMGEPADEESSEKAVSLLGLDEGLEEVVVGGNAEPEDPDSVFARLMGDLSEIQNSALDGNDVADDIADELGDYLRNGDAPKGSHYEEAISLMMDAIHDGPQAQAEAAEEAINLLNYKEDEARGNNESVKEDIDLSDKTEELTQWFIKYDGYRGDNGDQLPMGWIKSMTATGVGPDGWEEEEWNTYQDKLGKDITDMSNEEIDAFIDDPKNSPITSAMIDDLLKITGASTADEDLARAVSSAIGIGESLDEGQYDGKSREELLKMKARAEADIKNFQAKGGNDPTGQFLDDTAMMQMQQHLDFINDALKKIGESVEEGAVEKLKLSPEMQEKVKNATEAELERMAFAFGGDSLRAGDELDMLRKAKAELQGKKDEGFDRESFRKAFEEMVESKFKKGDKVTVDGKETEITVPDGPGPLVGVKKDGKTDMVKADKVKKKTDESINEDPYSQMPADMKEKIIAMYAKMLGGDKKKADLLLQRALSPKGQAAIKQKFGVGEDLEEGKSKHPKGSKKYKDQMAAKHAAMNEAFDEDEMEMDLAMDPDQEMDMSPEQVIDQADEIDMAMGQLEFIKYAAEEIKGHFKMGFEMEEWFQNKLARVHGTMMTLHAYIEGEEGKAGMNESINESIEKLFQEDKLGFEDAVRVVRESGGQQTINFVDTALYKWATRVANQKFEGRKAELYAGLLYERNGGDFEITDVLQEGVFDKDGMLGKFVSRDNGTDITTGEPNPPTFMGVNVKTRDDKIKALKTQIQMAKRSAPKSGLTPKDVPDLEKKLAKLEKEAK